MDARFFNKIDWARPWLAPLKLRAQPILQAKDWRAVLNEAAAQQGLCNHRGRPIHFVPQSDLPSGIPYEAFISETGGVPTRDNLHDFFNALIWLSFPNIKKQLNARQATKIAGAASTSTLKGWPAVRGKVRDAATIFDENAALFITCDMALLEALRERRWMELFMKQRGAFGKSYEVRLFGHALIEKLVNPYKAITAHACGVPVSTDYFVCAAPEERRILVDTEVACSLTEGLSTADFMPLPVLGLPDWAGNQDEKFYADATVFRPKS